VPLPSTKVWPASGPSAAPKLLIPKPWGLQSRRHPANPARRGAPRAVARTKEAPAANRGQVNKDLWEVRNLPDSPAAGRNVSRGNILARMARAGAVALWPSPSELPCFSGTSPSGILGFGVSRARISARRRAAKYLMSPGLLGWRAYELGMADRVPPWTGPTPASLNNRAKNLYELKTRGVLAKFSFCDLLERDRSRRSGHAPAHQSTTLHSYRAKSLTGLLFVPGSITLASQW